jgi:hypothetical protein
MTNPAAIAAATDHAPASLRLPCRIGSASAATGPVSRDVAGPASTSSTMPAIVPDRTPVPGLRPVNDCRGIRMRLVVPRSCGARVGKIHRGQRGGRGFAAMLYAFERLGKLLPTIGGKIAVKVSEASPRVASGVGTAIFDHSSRDVRRRPPVTDAPGRRSRGCAAEVQSEMARGAARAAPRLPGPPWLVADAHLPPSDRLGANWLLTTGRCLLAAPCPLPVALLHP